MLCHNMDYRCGEIVFSFGDLFYSHKPNLYFHFSLISYKDALFLRMSVVMSEVSDSRPQNHWNRKNPLPAGRNVLKNNSAVVWQLSHFCLFFNWHHQRCHVLSRYGRCLNTQKDLGRIWEQRQCVCFLPLKQSRVSWYRDTRQASIDLGGIAQK